MWNKLTVVIKMVWWFVVEIYELITGKRKWS